MQSNLFSPPRLTESYYTSYRILVKRDTTLDSYAGNIDLSGLRVLVAYFTKLTKPLDVEDLKSLGPSRYENEVVDSAFKSILTKYKLPHASVTWFISR